MGVAAGKSVLLVLLLINFAIYMIVLGIAGWALNRTIDASPRSNFGFGFSRFPIGNSATVYFVVLALAAGVVGVASVFSGVYHIRMWRKDSQSAAASSALIAWLLTLLAFGVDCKEIHLREGRGKRVRALEAFVIILGGIQLIYLLVLVLLFHWDREMKNIPSTTSDLPPKTATATAASAV